ncbi:putative G-protein coupled receptor 25 [Crotalus adamanteus]|uniref:G-protein coupled receptor 25 n=1 Tax=Crotalus adamanteus TaxID=8729 RepID=A0AAW1BRN8_CROAD
MVQKRGNQRLVDNFVLNLAIADLVFVCTLPFWALTEAFDSWWFGEELCKFSSYAISVNRCSSILFLMGMSVERFLVMNKHWDSRSLGTKRNSNITCAFITYGVVQNIDFSCEVLKALRRGLIISACLAFTNSCINPIIYAFMDQQFRQKVLKNFLALRQEDIGGPTKEGTGLKRGKRGPESPVNPGCIHPATRLRRWRQNCSRLKTLKAQSPNNVYSEVRSTDFK